MSAKDREKWNAIYSKNNFGFFPPAMVLHQYQHLLPETGKALDYACGQGRNAVHLSRLGLETHAMDVSDIAINKLNEYAEHEQLTIHCKTCDLKQETLPAASFDIIVISHFFDRNLIDNIKNALTENGLIFYQTFTKIKVEDIGPSSPEYLLNRNELLQLFNDFKILVYKEEADIGNRKEGFRNEAMIVAQK